TKSVEFFFDVGSPASYLAWTQLPKICERHGASLQYRPMLLGAVFKATGNQTPSNIVAKGKWMQQDMARFAKRYGVPFKRNPYFPVNTLQLMRGAIWALQNGRLETYLPAVFQAMWVDGADLNQPDEIKRVLDATGVESGSVLAAVAEPAIKNALIEQTNQAIERGIFGAPTMFVNDEMHFGQDRLDWVEAALSQ
ncbi:MAG: 2-hydroxychromene-2-carboxylate isomerase, partial [Burkholderiaceae bacterium]